MNLENIRELREVSGTEEINALLATGKWRVLTFEYENMRMNASWPPSRGYGRK